MAITRFMARRGKPHKTTSDNGTNFVETARQFIECFNEWDSEDLREPLASLRVVWKFNTPVAPDFVVIWQSLVHSCKKGGNRRLTLRVLTTTMYLFEQSLNSRPLTPLRDDPEVLEALTPNYFLLGRPVVAEPLMTDSVRYVDYRKVYKVAEAYNQMIWIRWAKNYLPKWNVRMKWSNDDERILKAGELVWLTEEPFRRHENKMGLVIECFAEPMVSFHQH